nr:hypothetical protein [Tanacetum cinerariifolium]
MNVAQPKITSFAKTAHSNVKRSFQRQSTVKNQPRVPRVSTITEITPTVDSKFPTVKSTFTADLGDKRKVVKASARWIWRPKQNTYEQARIHAEEELKLMIDGPDRSNEVIAKHLNEYEQAEADLSVGEKIELISELVKYQDHLAEILKIETTDQETKIIATVDSKPRTISESSLRRHLKLNDEEGIISLPDAELFENLSLMGYNILPSQSNIAIAIVCLATNRVYNFSKMIFDDEPASLSRDDRHREAFPTVSGLDAGQDRENIAKTSAMVPYLDADEGKDKERRCAKPIQEDALTTWGIIDTREELGADKNTKKVSNDTEEMVNVLSSMEDTNILSSGGATFSTASVSPADVFPTAGVPTVSRSFPTVSEI